MGKHADYKTYQATVGGSLSYKLQEMLSKGTGNYFAVKEPIDKFTQKIWGGVTSVDDFIHYPQHKLADWVEKTTEKYPWLNPVALITEKWAKYQTGIAIRIHQWAIGIPAESAAWLKSFAGHVGDLKDRSRSYWGGASHFLSNERLEMF
jgi:hypothetical protein